MEPLDRNTVPLSPVPPLRQLWGHAGRHRPKVVLATIFSVLNKIMDIAPELLIGAAVDVVVGDGTSFIGELFGIDDPFDQLTVLAILTVIIWVLESITDYIAEVLWRNLAQDIEHEMRMDSYRHVQELELAYFEDRTSGGLMAVLNDDINQLERFLDNGANTLVQFVTSIVLIGAIFFCLSPMVATIAILPIPAIVLGAFWYQGRAAPLYQAGREHAGRLAGRLANDISGVATIKSFTAAARTASYRGSSFFW